jgi:threonyl-tRNA synthetase
MPVIQELSRDSMLYRIRHSFAHVLAQAVQSIQPKTRLGFGPPIDDGFYYDFILEQPLALEDLPRIEEIMRKIIRENQTFHRDDLPADSALERIRGMQEPHKLEYAKELIDKNGETSLRFFTNGPFLDMCEGPHVDSTGQLPKDAFKLHSIAGAYWRGDERNVMMTRIYGYAFETSAELQKRVADVELAKKRDHRKLAKEMQIYVIDDRVGAGLALWLPNGTVIRTELEKLAQEMEFKAGYQRVATPHITKKEVYETSGHIPLYTKSMYPPMTLEEEREHGDHHHIETEQYYMKPMNCPHHHILFGSLPRSYRDLPLRLAEYGTVYRYEKSGQLHGLARVRGMTMNDAHLYVTPEQLKAEFQGVMKLHFDYYKLFEFENFFLRLSLWDPNDPKRTSKYVDNPEGWAFTEKLAQDALEEMGLYYKLAPGEAAFYGPKVDVQFNSVLEKEFTVSTNQIDFAAPTRFDLKYVDRDGQEKRPYVIHRAPLGTHERFVAFLLEHYGGAFPTWLAPVQVAVVPVSEKTIQYATNRCR